MFLGHLGSTKKKWGPINSNFWGRFFMFLGQKIFFLNTNVSKKLHNELKRRIWIFNKIFGIKLFFRCAHSQMWMYYIKVSYCGTGYLDWAVLTKSGIFLYFLYIFALLGTFWLFLASNYSNINSEWCKNVRSMFVIIAICTVNQNWKLNPEILEQY